MINELDCNLNIRTVLRVKYDDSDYLFLFDDLNLEYVDKQFEHELNYLVEELQIRRVMTEVDGVFHFMRRDKFIEYAKVNKGVRFRRKGEDCYLLIEDIKKYSEVTEAKFSVIGRVILHSQCETVIKLFTEKQDAIDYLQSRLKDYLSRTTNNRIGYAYNEESERLRSSKSLDCRPEVLSTATHICLYNNDSKLALTVSSVLDDLF